MLKSNLFCAKQPGQILFVRILAAGLLVVLIGGSSAVRAQQTRTITFDEAVNIALQQNTLLKRARNRVDQQKIDVSRSYLSFTPTLSVSAGGRHTFGRNFLQSELRIVNFTSQSFSVNAGAGVTLFNGFRRFASLDQAQVQAAASTQRLERTRAEVVFQVIQRYIGLVEAQGQIRLRTEQLAYQRELLDQIEALVEVGTRPASDLYQQQASVAEAELALLQAEQAYEVSKTQLINVLNLDPFGAYEFTAPSLDEVESLPVEYDRYDLKRLVERAYQRRADLDAAQLSVRAAAKGIDVAQSGYYPSIRLSAGYGSGWTSIASRPLPGDGVVQPTFFEQLNSRRGGSVGLSLSFSLFDRLQTRHAVESAQVQLQTARYDLRDLRQEIALQVRQAILDYRQARKALAVSQEALEAARRAREAAQARYRLGAAPYVELSQANATYVSAASQHVRARYTLLFRRKLIDYYVGVLGPTEPLIE